MCSPRLSILVLCYQGPEFSIEEFSREYEFSLLNNSAAAAKSLQSCPTLCDPIDGSPPGSPSLEFSRQEHWSGLPFPSPMHENEKWKWSCLVVSDSSWPHGLQPTRLLHPWDFPGKSTGVGCHCLLPLHKFIWSSTHWDIFLSLWISETHFIGILM